MLDPAVLKAEFQGAHISGHDQLPGLDTEIRHDPLAGLARLQHAEASGGAEGQLISPERGAGKAKAHPGRTGEGGEGMTPGRGLRFIRVQSQVMDLIGNGHPAATLEMVVQFQLQTLPMADGGLVADQQSAAIAAGIAGAPTPGVAARDHGLPPSTGGRSSCDGRKR